MLLSSTRTAKTTQYSQDDPVQPRRPSTLTLVLIRRWTHLIPPLTPHSPFVPATSCPDPNIDPQVDQAYFAPHPPPPHPLLPHGFNYNISKTSLLYRLSLICFYHLRTLSKNRTNERTAASLFPQCPCRGKLFVYCCCRCSCFHLRGEPVSNYFFYGLLFYCYLLMQIMDVCNVTMFTTCLDFGS